MLTTDDGEAKLQQLFDLNSNVYLLLSRTSVKVYRQQRKAVRNRYRGESADDQPLSKEEYKEMQVAIKDSKITRKRKYLASIMRCSEDEVGEISDTDF